MTHMYDLKRHKHIQHVNKKNNNIRWPWSVVLVYFFQ